VSDGSCDASVGNSFRGSWVGGISRMKSGLGWSRTCRRIAARGALAMPPSCDQRDSVPAADRHPLEGPASPLRQVEDGSRPSSKVVGGRHMGENPAGRPGRRRCRRPDRLEHGQRRFHDLPRSSTRGWRIHSCPEDSGSAKETGASPLRRGPWTLARRAHLQDPPRRGGGRRPLGFVITPGQGGTHRR
jgi:hypothetical protein